MTKQKANGSAGVPVGEPIALLAEEGDDISNLSAPEPQSPQPKAPSPSKDDAPQQSTSASSSDKKQEGAPAHSEKQKPSPSSSSSTSKSTSHSSHAEYLPSVQRLLTQLSSGQSVDQIKRTGKSGRLTKGDVLAFLGHASSPEGTLSGTRLAGLDQSPKWGQGGSSGSSGKESSAGKKVEPLDGMQFRRMILEGLSMPVSAPLVAPKRSVGRTAGQSSSLLLSQSVNAEH